MKKKTIIGGTLVALLPGGAVAVFAATWPPAIAAIEPPKPQKQMQLPTPPVNGYEICR